jgi:hypothetical protein
MHNSQHKKKRDMKKQGNMTSPKRLHSLIVKSKDTEMDEMLDKEFKRIKSSFR